jgi:hypothetical protein
LPSVIANDVTLTVAPEEMDVVERFRSAPDVPTDPWTFAVPPDVTNLKNDAVPVASADESDVIALAVRTPPDAAGANVELSGSCARSVFPLNAAPTFAGGVPL